MKFESKALDKLYNQKDKAHMLVEAARGGVEVRVLGSYEYTYETDEEGEQIPVRKAKLYIPASELVNYGVKKNKLHPFNFDMIYEFRLCGHDDKSWWRAELDNEWINTMTYLGVIHPIVDNDSSYDFYINMYPEFTIEETETGDVYKSPKCKFYIDNDNKVYNTGRCPFYE